MSDLRTYLMDGYPAVALISYAIILGAALYQNRGNLNFKNPSIGGFPFVIVNFLLIAFAVFFAFPDMTSRFFGNCYFFIGLIGLLAAITGNKNLVAFYGVFGGFVFLMAIGLMYTFAPLSDGPASHIDPLACLVYASETTCKDDGYLQFIRVIWAFSFLILPAGIVLAKDSAEASAN